MQDGPAIAGSVAALCWVTSTPQSGGPVEPFVYQSLSQRIVFGSGTLARVGEKCGR